ncbi:TIGR02680 family protein [Parafrankia sp. BMG5.11]|uniref:TIGR02680 family protein n=1 Tax=Parafrankia sp. BMG5.11 TaxID=222540 RepID=UPI0035A0CD8B
MAITAARSSAVRSSADPAAVASAPSPGTSLPAPGRDRWQPLRAGLVDLFYYDVEEFHFHDGRLLLRGNNGTGKSKVLALTLPFLLDGELAAHRVEPDGDRNKRMEWNLLLGGRHPHPERLGYAWLEFGRTGQDGVAEYRTVGAGLKAVAGRGIARHWFFVTPQRVGADLSLVGPTRVALTREKLKDVVEGHGQVFDTASHYRRAVDEELFGLGTHRYEALVNLLIQLRQPQLSKRPDEKLLSRALTEALAPLDPALVATVAEAFRGLDEEREALRALTEAQAAAQAFLSHYSRYAQVAARRHTAPPRQAHSRYEQYGRELGEAEEAHRTAQAALDTALAELDALDAAKEILTARREALRESPEMRSAAALNTARQDASRLAQLASQRTEAATQAARSADSWQRRLAEAATAVDDDQTAFDGAVGEADAAAGAALLADRHPAVLDELAREQRPYAGARRSGEAAVDAQDAAVSHLERLLRGADDAAAAARAARTELDRIIGERHAVAERIATAEDVLARRGADLVAACTAYLGRAEQLRLPDPDGILAALAGWVETLDGRSPAAAAVDDAVRETTALLGRRQAAVDAEKAAARAELDALTEEIARLVAGGHDVPPTPYTRDGSGRAGRPGAPLWKVVDFAAGVPDEHRAGIEAALEAAGILDAWVGPDGRLRDAVSDDVLVTAGFPTPGDGLATVLVPAVDRADPAADALSDQSLADLLATIGLRGSDRPSGPDRAPDGSASWVGVDGSFGNGTLTGSWHKPAAGYIGEGSREAARRARLGRLRADAELTEERLTRLAAAGAELADRLEALAAEHRAFPADTDLRDAHATLSAEHATRRRVDADHDHAAAIADRRRQVAAQAREQVEDFAADVRLPVEPAALASVRRALGDYRTALARLWPAATALARSRTAAAGARAELAEVTARHRQAAEEQAEAEAQADAGAERHRVLAETAGAAVDELFRKLAAVEAELADRDRREKAARAAERAAIDARGKADGRRETLRASITAAAAERESAIARLRAFAATGLLTVAVPDLDLPDTSAAWAPNPAIALARAVNAALGDVDDSDRRWELVQQRVSGEHKILTDALSRHGHSVGMTVADGVIVVDVLFQGRRQDVPELVTALAGETEQRALLLSAKEREVLENHLVNEVASALQELVSDTEEQVGRINTNLAERPTSTGMRLRLQWRMARGAPAGLGPVRDRLLRQTTDAWSAADRATVGAFLQEEISREHSADASGGWAEQLTRALDYRRWHEFAVQRFQDGQWRPASGPASGGERVLAASIPLFAAAASFYDSAGDRRAPRLIALDEAFAGVDDDSRAKCLGLLATFDLDVVMTSEREWGCYPQVPGLAIAQLSRRDGVDAVLVTPWRWDGRERTRLDRPSTYLPAPAAQPEVAAASRRARDEEHLPLFGEHLPVGDERLPLNGDPLPLGDEPLPPGGEPIPHT